MDHISAAPIFALEEQPRFRSPATVKPIPWIEKHVGAMTAAAAGTILEALAEHQNGGLIQKTREQIGESIWQLYRIRCVMVPSWDFDAIAREQGTAALRAADISPRTAQIAIDEVLRVLRAVIRETVN